MILKEADDRSTDIAELHRLQERSPAAFKRIIQKAIRNIRSGCKGERDAAHFLNRELGDDERMMILHDLRIDAGGEFAQIDHLVVHRYQAAAWVLETKNYSGRLSCDEHGDWTVWYNGKPQPVPSPVNQARRQCKALRLWLDANGGSSIRTIHPVVLISPTSSVDRKKLPAETHVVKSDNFAEWRKKQAEGLGTLTLLGMIGRHVLNGLTQEEMLDLGKRLVLAHVPARYDWRARLHLPQTDEPACPEPVKQSTEPTSPKPAARSAGVASRVFATPHGNIIVSRIPDGRFALRNDKNDALIEIVRGACKGKAQWNPRYRNWLVSEDNLAPILAATGGTELAPGA